ncbi:zinc finger protein 518A [Eleginops maclovinus]|uniref:zinc finger protein 518A n=1 Tax=Eleginops maclovinus TaxID=56733 RepID=UPI00308004B7
MDSGDICAATSRGDNKRRVNKKNRDWHKRPHLRNSVVQPPTMQSEDKRGPKKIAEGWEQSTVWPSSKKPPQEAQQGQHRINDNGNTLRFTCSQCRDKSEYVPKDLVKHFKVNHRGSPPVFSCHTCTFSTHELSYLQVHQLSHMDTFSCCGICKDNIQRTWPEFTAHLTMYHSQNGRYSCEMCQKFSTGDVQVFLGHMYEHHFGLEEGNYISLRTRGRNKLGSKTNSQSLRCQHCGFEASQKWLLTKHVKAVHLGQNQRQKKKPDEVNPIAMKPNDPIPKMKPRLTRSAVKEMCWLTQDCLSLPGKEFLDKYCHLSDPQTTLEETQQFLMESVAGETGGQKWSKALKTVFSNVPQDINLYPKSENGIVSNSSDLAFLTAKNKMTVAQNGKRLKMMTSLDKETHSPESAPDDTRRVVDQNGCQSNLSDQSLCPQTETKLNDMLPAQCEPSACAQMQENRENQGIKRDQEMEDNIKKPEEPMHEDRNNISCELQPTNESKEQTSIHKVLPNNKRRRRKRRARSKKAAKRSSGSVLKIVLKKNPVKGRQWVTQSSLSPSGCGQTDGPPNCHEQLEEFLQNTLLTEEHQQKMTKASDTDDLSKAITQNPQPKQGEELTPSCAAKTTQSKNTDGNTPVELKGLPPMHQESRHESDKPPDAEVEEGSAVCETGQINSRVAAGTEEEICPGNAHPHTSGSNTDTPHSSSTRPSPVSQPVIAAQGKVPHTDVSHALSSEDSVEGVRVSEAPADLHLDFLSHLSSSEAILTDPIAASGNRWLPKDHERTLKLVAINPSQLVKRPSGDQPVVVLNHPDADIPEATRIMKVINRYRGEVQKVVLSQRTLSALAAAGSDSNAIPDTTRHAENSVQERFVLKLKLRRLSRKKYEVVGAAAPRRDARKEFRCWFCGRVFTCQETWMVHRQRHLMEWKGPKCENS